MGDQDPDTCKNFNSVPDYRKYVIKTKMDAQNQNQLSAAKTVPNYQESLDIAQQVLGGFNQGQPMTVIAPGMQVHVHFQQQSPDTPQSTASSEHSEDDVSEQDPEMSTIKVNLRKLSHPTLAEIGMQLCLCC